MMLLPCPWCGPRNVSEFHYVGERAIRPDPASATEAQWRDYLYTKRNACDWTDETWYHGSGCRQHFTVERHTLTNQVREVSR